MSSGPDEAVTGEMPGHWDNLIPFNNRQILFFEIHFKNQKPDYFLATLKESIKMFFRLFSIIC
jgi:hypothetical protein